MTRQTLSLGSVQLGMSYGCGSSLVSLNGTEVESILRCASELNIQVIDTASLYGSAEERLSKSKFQSQFSYVTKTIKCDEPIVTAEFVRAFVDRLYKSLELLGGGLYGVLFHRPADILKPGGEALLSELFKLKGEGKIKKVGFSIYEPKELYALKKYTDFDLVQLPSSIFDQRAEKSELVQALFKSGVEFHSRSTFLKGAIFLKESQLPKSLRPEFGRIRAFKDMSEELGLSPAEMAFSYVKKQKFISKVVIGAQSSGQLRQLFGAYNSSEILDEDYMQFAFCNHRLLNPGNW